ncbi:MAG: carboxypeptidase regulatory-like domain-containing protein [Terriglobales bacterium]
MKRYLMVLLLAVMSAGVIAPSLLAQDFAQVKGVCKDRDGKPLAGATVEWLNTDNGRKYDLKTNKKGEYFSLGLDPGNYKVTLLQDGKELFHIDKQNITRDPATGNLDFDLQKEQQDEAKRIGLTPEQLKQRQEAEAQQQKEVTTVKTLNEKLQAANQSMKAGDFDSAVTTLTEANQMDPNRDVLWAALAEAYAGSAQKQTDPAEKSKRLDQAIQDYGKSIDLKKAAMAKAPKPDANAQLAGLYNNMARAEANTGKVDQAIADYNQAAQLNPATAGTYYFNLGATLTNANKSNDEKMRKAAIDAFDKAIAADPNHADAYFYKGTNLVGGATLQGDKMVAPEGTAEAFNKYLELQPTGPHAADAKAMLASIGAPVETSFGKKKSKK